MRKTGDFNIFNRKYKLNKARSIAVGAALVLLIVVSVSLKNIMDLRAERNTLIQQNQALKEEKKKLKDELKNVNDMDYIEEQARLQLRLIKPGETLFIVEKENDKEGEKGETKN